MQKTLRQYPCAFIPDDGYLETGYIAGVVGAYPPVWFRYRPMRFSQGAQLWKEHQHPATGFGRQIEIMLAAIENVTEWDIVDPAGNRVAPTTENKAKVTQQITNIMAMIVMGTASSDLPPVPTAAETTRRVQVACEAAQHGIPPAAAGERVDAGNS